MREIGLAPPLEEPDPDSDHGSEAAADRIEEESHDILGLLRPDRMREQDRSRDDHARERRQDVRQDSPTTRLHDHVDDRGPEEAERDQVKEPVQRREPLVEENAPLREQSRAREQGESRGLPQRSLGQGSLQLQPARYRTGIISAGLIWLYRYHPVDSRARFAASCSASCLLLPSPRAISAAWRNTPTVKCLS